MSKNIRYLLLGFALIFAVSCTGKRNNATLQFKIKKQGKVNAYTDELTYVAVNIRQGSKDSSPIATFSADAQDNSWAVAEDIDVTFDNLPSGTTYIQFMGAYDKAGGGMDFAYTMEEVALEPGDNVVNLTASFVASSSVPPATVAGRYLTTVSTGPTGKLLMKFQPPNDDPAMEIMKTEMFNGWFRAFAIETDAGSGAFTFEVEETGEILFGGPMKMSDFDTLMMANGSAIMKGFKPATHNKYDDEERGPEYIYMGFFPASGVSVSGKNVCWSTLAEAIPGEYTDEALSQPLIYNGGTAVTTKAHRENGGLGSTYSDYYLGASCDDSQIAAGNALRFYHHQLNEGLDGATGIRGPFLAAYPHQPWGHFVKTNYDSVGNNISMEWTFLPGVEGTAVDGVSVYYYPGQINDFHVDDEDEIPCDEAALDAGFTFLADTNTHTLSGQAVPGLTTSNFHDFRFLICPFKDGTEGRKYYASGLDVHGINDRGNTLEDQHFGWGVVASSYAQTYFTDSQMGGDYFVVNGVTPGADVTTLAASGASYSGRIAAGDEVLVMVVAEDDGGSGDCDADVNPGDYFFTRAVNADDSPTAYVSIPTGTWADNLNNTNLSNSHSPGISHCEVQVVRVPHFSNLTLNANVIVPPYTHASNGGGAIAFRVNGQLSLNLNANIMAEGLLGSTGSGDYAAGFFGKAAASDSGSGGLGGTTSGGGGGGYKAGGAGGNAESGGLGLQSVASNVQRPLFFGGGGGYGGNAGGSGGGAIFIAAKKISANTTHEITVDGQSPSGSSAEGGGGAGSIRVIADTLTGAGTLNLFARGGNGNAFSTDGGGGGGGGLISYEICDSTGIASFGDSSAGGSGGVASSSGADGVDGDPPWTPSQTPHFCQ